MGHCTGWLGGCWWHRWRGAGDHSCAGILVHKLKSILVFIAISAFPIVIRVQSKLLKMGLGLLGGVRLHSGGGCSQNGLFLLIGELVPELLGLGWQAPLAGPWWADLAISAEEGCRGGCLARVATVSPRRGPDRRPAKTWRTMSSAASEASEDPSLEYSSSQ